MAIALFFLSCKKDFRDVAKTDDSDLLSRMTAVQGTNSSTLQAINYTFTKLFDITSTAGGQQGLAFGHDSFYIAWDAGSGYGRITQYDSSGRELKRTDKLAIGHSAEASYRQANGKLYIANGGLTGSPTFVYEVDMRQAVPVVERTLDFTSLGSNGMVAVDNSNGQLLVFAGPNGGPYTIATADFDGNVLSKFSIVEKLGIPQGIEVLGNEILYYTSLSTTPKSNQITVFSIAGTKLYTIAVPIAAEGQGLAIDETTRKVYVGTINTNQLNKMSPAFESTAFLGVNLLMNPNAEGGAGGTGFSVPVPIPFWAGNGATVLQYSRGSFNPVSPGGRSQFFAGSQSASGTLKQQVNIASLSNDIDAGVIAYSLKGWLGGYSTQNDNAKVTATFLNSSGSSLGAATIGPVQAADRNSVTGFVQRSISGSVPPGARSVLATITMTRTAGTNCDGYADDLSLVLTKR